MTIAFMALLAAVIADRVNWVAGRALLWPLVVVGIASIAWWIRTEAAGHGDLRPHALVQFLPMLLLPLMLFMWKGEGCRRGISGWPSALTPPRSSRSSATTTP